MSILLGDVPLGTTLYFIFCKNQFDNIGWYLMGRPLFIIKTY